MIVTVRVPPSSTVVGDGVTETVGTVSVILTVELVVTAVPVTDPVLTIKLNVSVPSVVDQSPATVLVIVATPVVDPVPTILKEPVKELSTKSLASTVPLVL